METGAHVNRPPETLSENFILLISFTEELDNVLPVPILFN